MPRIRGAFGVWHHPQHTTVRRKDARDVGLRPVGVITIGKGNTILAMGYTREQLESMAEYNAEVATKLDSEQMVSLGKS